MIKKGIVLSFLTACISGISIFSNAIFVSHADPLIFSIVRNALVALLLTVILAFTKQTKLLRQLSRKQWGMLMLIGAIGGGIPFAMFFTGLSTVGAVNGNILQKSLFLWVLLLAVPVLKERISKTQLIGYIALFVGMFVFGGTYKLIPSTGAFLVLGATILWAIENVIAKISLEYIEPGVVAWGRMVFGLPFLLGAAAVFGKTPLLLQPSAYMLMPLVVSSVLLVLYVTTWYWALSKAPATVVSSVLVFAPVVTAVLGMVLFHKAFVGQQGINALLLIIGSLLVSMTKEAPKVLEN